MNTYHAITVARASLPRLTLAQRVVDRIARNAAVYQTETGESLIGFAIKRRGRTEPDLYVVETIAPDESAVRLGAYFEQGDDVQGDIFNWWSDSWKQLRELKRDIHGNPLDSKWDIPLMNLGDWHKHPGTLIEPSWGDTSTAREHIHDKTAGIPQLIAILATVWDKARAESFEAQESADPISPTKVIKVPLDDKTVIRLDCWYMSRNTRRFVRLSPTIVADDTLPTLPAIPWTLSNPDRLRKEFDLLQKDGYSTYVEFWDADKQPPLEVSMSVAKMTSTRIFFVTTQPDFPNQAPKLYTAPMSLLKTAPKDANMYDVLWAGAEPVPEAMHPTWTPDKTLLDVVHNVEGKFAEKERNTA